MSALADVSALDRILPGVGLLGQSAREQFEKRGVYIHVFEQSILAEKQTNKPWSFAASLAAEGIVVGVLVIIPLVYGDHLPDFRWKNITIGPQIHRAPQQPVQVRRTSGPARPDFANPSRVYNPTLPRSVAEPAVSPDQAFVDLPSNGPIGGYESGPPGPQLFTQQVRIDPPKPTLPVRPPPSGPIRVSQGVQMAKLIKQVLPVYPPIARTAHVSGVVRLIGIIAKDGTIRNLQVISGHPLLTRAALEAVSQWIYKPTLLSGEPVEVICPIDVNFTLNQ